MTFPRRNGLLAFNYTLTFMVQNPSAEDVAAQGEEGDDGAAAGTPGQMNSDGTESVGIWSFETRK